MSRKRVVWWSVAGVAIAALGVYAVVGEWIPGPKPTRPNGSWEIANADWNSTEPEWGTELLVGGVRRDSAVFSIYLGYNNWEHATVRVGETDGTIINPSRAYYGKSLDGTTPTCP